MLISSLASTFHKSTLTTYKEVLRSLEMDQHSANRVASQRASAVDIPGGDLLHRGSVQDD